MLCSAVTCSGVLAGSAVSSVMVSPPLHCRDQPLQPSQPGRGHRRAVDIYYCVSSSVKHRLATQNLYPVELQILYRRSRIVFHDLVASRLLKLSLVRGLGFRRVDLLPLQRSVGWHSERIRQGCREDAKNASRYGPYAYHWGGIMGLCVGRILRRQGSGLERKRKLVLLFSMSAVLEMSAPLHCLCLCSRSLACERRQRRTVRSQHSPAFSLTGIEMTIL